MAKLVKIDKQEAIRVMENNLKILKESRDSDTFSSFVFGFRERNFFGKKKNE